MDDYTLMRLSDNDEDDALDYDDNVLSKDDATFKEKYKEFYSDIKTDICEDW